MPTRPTTAWSADSRWFFYTVHDEAYRPFQVWRHELGTDPSTDTLLFEEAQALRRVEPVDGEVPERPGVGVRRGAEPARRLRHALGRHRLLVPRRPVGNEPATHLDPTANRQPSVDLDHQLDFVARRLYTGRLYVATRSPATQSRDCIEDPLPPVCTCGTVELWVNQGDSPKTSQMLADWYSASHIVHGFLFYGALWLLFRRWSAELRLLAAIGIESAWEIAENTPMVIDRYREATAALGYSGDSILNSLSDIAMMGIGFLAARRLPLWASVGAVGILELVPLLVIRDNLTLNVWMLLAPSDSVRAWQAG